MLYQVRFNLDDELAIAVRGGVALPVLQILNDILEANNAELICQLDAFEDFCKKNGHLATKARFEGDADGLLPLFLWTDACLREPEKREKYGKNFTVYIDGEMLYSGPTAKKLLHRLESLPFLQGLRVHNDNPADNPPIPDEFLNI
jgi:hypothetical protein